MMDKYEYYSRVFPKLANSFDHASWVLAYGPELIRRGWDPDSLQVTVEPVDHLYDLTVKDGMEVFLPIVESDKSVLAPIDFEIFLSHENNKLYEDEGSQRYYHEAHIKPISDFFETFMQSYRLPYLLDLTPSGGHVLFHVQKGTPAYSALASVGYLERELLDAYTYQDEGDLKRVDPCGFDAGSVFSGIGRVWSYVSLLAKEGYRDLEMPVTICDSEDKCVNIDNSWQADPAFMRIMRSPYSLHRKNIHKYGKTGHPLVDVSKTYYDGNEGLRVDDLGHLISCMWDMEKAAAHSDNFTGHIPVTNDNMVRLVEDYKKTNLYSFNCDFDATDELYPGEALHRAHNDGSLSDKSKSVIAIPNPRLLQPNLIKKFVRDLMSHGWHPKHIGSLMNDLYCQPEHRWNTNWLKYCSRTRANYWARTYAAVNMLEDGEDLLSWKR